MSVFDDLIGQDAVVAQLTSAAAAAAAVVRGEPGSWDVPRLAVHRATWVWPLSRCARLRRGPAVCRRRVRRLPRVPHGVVRRACRR